MPIYTYRCKECDNEFEVRQRMTDDPLTECPVCSGEIRRVVNSVGVVFKGKGFYVTDNRSGQSATLPGSKSDKSDKAASSDGASSGEGESSAKSSPESAAKPAKSEAPSATAV
mgnify:FL=1